MAPRARDDGVGLARLRRRGALAEILFLYECTTQEPTGLQPIAERLGLTVQAVSHQYGLARRRGLATQRDGRYVPTLEGVARLHDALRELGADVFARIGRLRVIRSCRAIALARLEKGAAVSLELRDGLLSARPGRGGASHGTVARGGAAGALVEVVDLEGIVELRPVPVSVRTFAESDLDAPGLAQRVRRELGSAPGVLAADGLEAYHLLRTATDRPVERFAAAAVVAEASRLGIPATVLVLDRELPRFLARLPEGPPPDLSVRPLGRGAARRP